MPPGTLEQLERAFVLARERLAVAHKRIAKASATGSGEAAELRAQIAQLLEEERELQQLHDQKQRHVDAARIANRRRKVSKKTRARNQLGAQKAQLRDRRLALQQQLNQLGIAAEANLRELQRAHADARHNWLLAIRAAETPDDVEQKLAYAKAAMVPEKYRSPDLVWCYTVGPPARPTTVHLFYGGKDAPDGRGHAHHMLRRERGQLILKFSRPPK